jgi:hypothetical protein
VLHIHVAGDVIGGLAQPRMATERLRRSTTASRQLPIGVDHPSRPWGRDGGEPAREEASSPGRYQQSPRGALIGSAGARELVFLPASSWACT